ncbi:MAG TPA: M13 family metallopeptidase [Cytophagaceae bacterium]|jgi:putative endopeptidase|nr:M13 family metallopeptidase [Cytophagaceae bacterium]
MIRSIIIALMGVAFLTACHSDSPSKKNSTGRTSFFESDGMDSTVSPGDNFFNFANGKWVKNTIIPDDQSRWGSFTTLYQDNLLKLKGLLEEAAKANAPANSDIQKLGDFYTSGMDTFAIDKLGATPLKNGLQEIANIKDKKELVAYMIQAYPKGNPSIYGLYVSADEKNSNQNIPILYQHGTSLPTKEYYTKIDSTSEVARKALVTYAATLFSLAGHEASVAAKEAAIVLALETSFAKYQRTPVELRDPQSNYNKISLADADKKWPNLELLSFFTHLKTKPDSIDVGQPDFYAGINKLLLSQPLDVWKTKLTFDYISANAKLLSEPFIEANFAFSRTFNGQKVDDVRWKKIINSTDNGLGDILGKMFVDSYFTPEAKNRMDELVNNLQKAFEARINHLDWMSDSTKIKAKEKLHTFLKKIGYPDKWKKYEDVTISKDNYFANSKSIEAHSIKEMLDKIGKPVDRTEWGMTTPTVNAYYNPTNNEIVFPAGILQFPFFDVNADDAINYGAIGMVIGHEMTHGFDDQGSQYDDKGNLKNWWLPSDNEKFKAKTAAIITEYDSFTVLDKLHVNGSLTLGENLADIGGLAIAYDAFKLTKQGQDTTKINGFTPDQRFFLGFAQVWRTKSRDARVMAQIKTDPHSPSMYRVNGPVQNFTPWYEAFGVTETNKMYKKPNERIKIW